MDITSFLKQWFGYVGGREVGCPARFYMDSPDDFPAWCYQTENAGRPVFMSVNPFKAGKVAYLERLFYDFDAKRLLCPKCNSPNIADLVKEGIRDLLHNTGTRYRCLENSCSDYRFDKPSAIGDPEQAWHDVRVFAKHLHENYDLEPLLVASGSKGYHCYLYFKKVILLDPKTIRFVSLLLRELQLQLLVDPKTKKKLQLSSLDYQVIGQLNRLSRVPGFKHDKTGRLCWLVDEDGGHLGDFDIDQYRTLPGRLLREPANIIKQNEKIRSKYRHHDQAWERPVSLVSLQIPPCVLNFLATAEYPDHVSGHQFFVNLLSGRAKFRWPLTDDQLRDANRRSRAPLSETDLEYQIEWFNKTGQTYYFKTELMQQANLCPPIGCRLCGRKKLP